MTPSIAVIQIKTPHWQCTPLWVPLFLLWIPAVLLLPFIFVAIFGLAVAGRVDPWRAMATLWNLVCSLPGTHVRVVADGAKVQVRIL
jgi:hypothetical protein